MAISQDQGAGGKKNGLSVFFGYIKECEREIRATKYPEAHLNEGTSTVAHIRVVGITLIIILAVSQLAMIVLARILGPGDFGTYAVCVVFINLLATASTFGLDSAVIHRQRDTDTAVESAAAIRFILSLIFAGLLFLAAPFIARVVGTHVLVAPLQVSGIAVIAAAFGFDASIRLLKDLQFKSVSLVRATNTAVWTATSLGLAYLGFRFWSLLAAYIAGQIAIAAVLWVIRPWKLPRKIDPGIARELLRYGVFPLGTGLLAFLVWNVDKLAVGAVLGSSALLGAYYVAFSYGMIIPNLFTGVTSTVMFPTFSKIQTDLAGLRERYLKTLKYIGYISIPAGVGLAVVSRTFVLGVLGSAWSEAVIPLAMFAVVGIVSSLTSPAGSIFLATGHPNRLFRQTLVMSVPYFVFLVPAIYYFKLVGVAGLFLLDSLGSLIWVLMMVADILQFSLLDELKMLTVPAGASAAMAAITFAIGHFLGPSMLSVAIQVFIAIPVYFSCVVIMTEGKFVIEAKDLLASARRK